MNKKTVNLILPYSEQGILNRLYSFYPVLSVDYLDDGVLVSVTLDSKGLSTYAKYIRSDEE